MQDSLKVEAAFRRLDIDDSGTITVSDLRQLLPQGLDDEAIQAVLDAADCTDKDGTWLSYCGAVPSVLKASFCPIPSLHRVASPPLPPTSTSLPFHTHTCINAHAHLPPPPFFGGVPPPPFPFYAPPPPLLSLSRSNVCFFVCARVYVSAKCNFRVGAAIPAVMLPISTLLCVLTTCCGLVHALCITHGDDIGMITIDEFKKAMSGSSA